MAEDSADEIIEITTCNPSMPPEWERHERTWMAWPSAAYTLGETPEEATECRQAWANTANAIVRFEPVTMLVNPDDESIARSFLDERVQLLTAKLDDAWMRDIGPTFVRTMTNQIAAVDWIFNGWGGQDWASYAHDATIAGTVANAVGSEILPSTLTNEGGGIHVNGAGSILLTRTVQLDPGRNPGWSQERVEAELYNLLGVTDFIWFERGLTRDYDEFGTRGHVDIVACFADEHTVLFHDQQNPEHPDFAVSAEVRTRLEETDFRIIAVPAPQVLRDDPSDPESWVDYSYINHYVCNDAVILCSFDDPADERARAILAGVYPGREIVLVDARPIFARGGGIHCITQQQPA